MKKITSIFMLLICLALVTNSFAQKRVTVSDSRSSGAVEYDNFQFGLKLGLNSALLTGDFGPFSPKALASAHLGVYFLIRPSKIVAIQPEIQFSGHGTKFVGDGDEIIWYAPFDYIEDAEANPFNELNYNLTYLNIHFLVKFFAVKGLNFEVGPGLGVLLLANGTGKSENYSEESASLNDNFTRNDLLLSLGVNYQFKFGLNLGLRYNHGLLNLNDLNDRDSNTIQNRVIQFSIGYSF